jgi:hypothetical protein
MGNGVKGFHILDGKNYSVFVIIQRGIIWGE